MKNVIGWSIHLVRDEVSSQGDTEWFSVKYSLDMIEAIIGYVRERRDFTVAPIFDEVPSNPME